jgi:hypothetical protein
MFSSDWLTYGKKRADERTRTADLISLRVIGHVLQGAAWDCKSSISRRLSLLRLAPCCTVLRSRWYQSGIKRPTTSVLVTSGVRSWSSFLSLYSPPAAPRWGKCDRTAGSAASGESSQRVLLSGGGLLTRKAGEDGSMDASPKE